ncbi:MAG: MotA/TolQ/ExbB proton channel family protein [Oscillospiraceae bacterium]|nr:MotA/TolQ/ExbB proton channel family protein [Oscillospiraceae bacterium]
MSHLKNLPFGAYVVILIIAMLFVLAAVLLFYVYARYKALSAKAGGKDEESRGFKGALLKAYISSYKKYGQDVNTPAIINDTISSRLSGLLLCERFLNNAVSLFVTLGLFGTFLGLSMSVSSLTELLGYSSGAEWMNFMESVGDGLLSALSGMGVAFYTSLFGVGCSILLTILRVIFNPATERERLATRLELWLDTEIAPTLATEAVKDERHMLKALIDTLDDSVEEIKEALSTASAAYSASTRTASASLAKSVESTRAGLADFEKTVGVFNAGVHDFAEVDYNLRGSVERMDLAVRDLAAALREINRRLAGSSTASSTGASTGTSK